jgi:hypothetical protein
MGRDLAQLYLDGTCGDDAAANGRVAILGGGTTSPDSPALFVLSRR